MKHIISIDGVRMKLESPEEIDQNSVKIISPRQDTGTQPIITPTEIGESLKELNKDEIESESRMSGIDLRSRLHHAEVPFILALDALVGLGVCHSKMLSFTRQKKRLSVSIDGKGRDDIIDVVAGKNERDAKQGFGDKVKNFFGMGGKQ